jgi:hypothetical protein
VGCRCKWPHGAAMEENVARPEFPPWEGLPCKSNPKFLTCGGSRKIIVSFHRSRVFCMLQKYGRSNLLMMTDS